jgi:hypothetical protein
MIYEKKREEKRIFTFTLFGKHGSVGDTLISQQSSWNCIKDRYICERF